MKAKVFSQGASYAPILTNLILKFQEFKDPHKSKSLVWDILLQGALDAQRKVEIAPNSLLFSKTLFATQWPCDQMAHLVQIQVSDCFPHWDECLGLEEEGRCQCCIWLWYTEIFGNRCFAQMLKDAVHYLEVSGFTWQGQQNLGRGYKKRDHSFQSWVGTNGLTMAELF